MSLNKKTLSADGADGSFSSDSSSSFHDDEGSGFPTSEDTSRSGASKHSTSSGLQIGFHNKPNNNNKELYGNQGDLLWKALVVTLLVLIGTAAGFVFLYGLIEGDLETTALVSRLVLVLVLVRLRHFSN
jgi:hypothetical protein